MVVSTDDSKFQLWYNPRIYQTELLNSSVIPTELRKGPQAMIFTVSLKQCKLFKCIL